MTRGVKNDPPDVNPTFRIKLSVENRLMVFGSQLKALLETEGEQFLTYKAFANLVILAGIQRIEAADDPLELLRELRKELRRMDEALKEEQKQKQPA